MLLTSLSQCFYRALVMNFCCRKKGTVWAYKLQMNP